MKVLSAYQEAGSITLNGEQALDLAFLVAEKLKAERLAGLEAAE